MLVLVAYDIAETQNRNELIKYLRSFGLYRIQKSVFAGELALSDRKDLSTEIEFFLSSDRDSIFIIPICESCKKDIEMYSEQEIFLPEDKEFRFI